MAAGGHFEAEPVEDFAILFIAEMNVVEGHHRVAHHQRGRIGQILHLALRVDQPEHFRHVDQSLPDGAIDHAQHVERTD